MSSNEARFHLSIRDGIFEIVGSEVFVAEQIQTFKDAIMQTMTRSNNRHETADLLKAATPTPADITTIEVSPSTTQKQTEVYSRVLHIEGEQVRVIKRIPGGTLAKKTVNTALVYLWGKRSIGINEVPMQEIRNLCQEQNCLDPSNFSGNLKNAKEYILLDGPRGSQSKTCKLTMPGIEEAEKVLSQLNTKQGE